MSSERFTWLVVTISLVLSVAAAGIFLTMPSIDLIVERQLFNPQTGFVLSQYPIVGTLRDAAIASYTVWYVAILLFAFDALKNPQRKLWLDTALGLPQWLYLAASSIAGPLLIANVLLKDNWGRARPREVTEFGGPLEFTPPLVISDQCQDNCSFVAGEPSAMVMIFISLAFVVPTRRFLFVVLAILLGGISGYMRMGLGGHFFSDVVFAGLFMSLTAAVIYWAMFLARWAKKT